MGWELGTLVILHLALGIWHCAFQFWSVAATFCFLTYDQACLLIQTNKQTNARMKQTTNATNKQMQQTSKCSKQQMQANQQTNKQTFCYSKLGCLFPPGLPLPIGQAEQ